MFGTGFKHRYPLQFKANLRTYFVMTAKYLRISAKCSDCCFAELMDADRNTIVEKDGYSPQVNALCGGDYIDFTIDLEHGTIVDWKIPAEVELTEAIEAM